MYLFYSALLAAGLLLTLPYWLLQGLRYGKYRAGLGERLGIIPARLKNDGRPVIWVHAVSLGEVLAIAELVSELRKRLSDYRIVISTTTDSGQRVARQWFGAKDVFYFPLDFAFAIRPYLKVLAPALMVIAETEFWPNLLRLSHARGARIAVVNARISNRSLRGYRRVHRWLAKVLSNIDVFLAQTSEDAQRLKAIGAAEERVTVAGNLKYDAPRPPLPAIIHSLRAAIEQEDGGPVIVCGSTVDEEELILLQAFENVLASHPKALMILAPRRPERFAEVAGILERLGIPFGRRSLWAGGRIAGGVLLVDTIGELAALYALADIAFVGGSLVPRGGHNIIEPAQHGVAIVVGNHTENFREIVALFRSHDALRVVSPAELPLMFMELTSNDAERIRLGRRAAEVLSLQKGATMRTVEVLMELLESPVDTDAGRGIAPRRAGARAAP